jgi:nucleotide-binding universal stress UspA family protein
VASYRTVLVGTDGSESSYRAVDKAAQVAADSGATLLVVCAYHPMGDKQRERAAEELGEDSYQVVGSHPAEDVLRDAADRARAAGAGDVQTAAQEGDPVDVLTSAAGDRGVDLIVVGNRGLNSLSARLLGSVPANVSHQARCDVLIVHTTSGRRR